MDILMIRGGFAASRNERALSEVVGFVLILGIITAAFSLYLVYGVPAQGRENEILHMNDIKDQFVSYKLSLDSLFNNNKVGTAVSNSFTLGTSGGYTQGSNSIIPILSPVSSSGVIAINQRGIETLAISSQSLIFTPNKTPIAFTPNNPPPLGNPSPPSNLTAYIDTLSPVTLSDISVPFGLDLKSIQSDGTNWEMFVNLTPRLTHYKYIQYSFDNNGKYTSQTVVEGDTYNRTDLTITVFKEGSKTLDQYILYSNIQNSPGNYSVNIMDDAYGLKSTIGVMNLTVTANNMSSPLAARCGGAIAYQYQNTPFTSSPISLGSLEYRAKNNYWIPQTYYYQMGGVFLAQSDGNITWKLPPEISFSNDSAHKIVTVNINALTLDNRSSGMVGGNSPVQVKTTLNSITPLPFATVAQGTGNTRWIRIGVNTTDDKAREMWKNYFNYTAMAAGIPNTQVGISSTESYIVINGPDTDPNGAYDINVIASNATYMPSVQGIGGIVQ